MSDLPDWLKEVDEYVCYRLTNNPSLRRDAEMWMEHGADMLTKIKQLIADRDALADCLRAVLRFFPRDNTATGVYLREDVLIVRERAEELCGGWGNE